MIINDELLERVREDQVGFSLTLRSPEITEQDIIALGAALKNNTRLACLEIAGKCLTDASVAALAEGLKGHPKLQDLSLNLGTLTDDGARHIADLVAHNPMLNVLEINSHPLTNNGIVAILDAAAESGALSVFKAWGNAYDAELLPSVARQLYINPPRNLVNITIGPEEGEPAPRVNAAKTGIENHIEYKGQLCYALGMALSNNDPKDWKIADLSNAGGQIHAIKAEIAPQRISELWGRLEKLPNFNLVKGTLTDLAEPNEDGFTAYDNPWIWMGFSHINKRLNEAGTPLTKQVLLETKNRDGEPVICNGIRNGRLKDILNALKTQGETLELEDLLKPDGGITPIMQAVLDAGQPKLVMTEAIWNNRNLNDLRQMMKTIPEDLHPRIPNRHGLTLMMQRRQQAEIAQRA